MNLDWQDHAACKGMDTNLFFPESTGVTGQRQARAAARVCAQCPVAIPCREYAAATNSVGVWGGSKSRVVRSRSPIPHGTEAGYLRHRRYKQQPCELCHAAAKQEWNRRNREKVS